MVSKRLFTTQIAMVVLADKCPSARKLLARQEQLGREVTDLSVIPGNGARL